ncbi:uncharacterized protein LOC143575624 [Bidens hawaiensis]|uniref:uncharacterized protein LOC143575624 n=1 Tax=Bidens hawaiensis TaxID=980011 RepID=UPI00404ABF34
MSAAAATSPTRKSKSILSLSGILKVLLLVIVAKFSSWVYEAALPPSPKMCGSPGGPPITSPRIQLHDGRHISYVESGVPKDVAKSKLLYVHCFDCCKHLNPFAIASPELVEELGVYIVAIDRPGYGESDPDPKRTVKSLALDIEEFANKLNLGQKFYVAGFSMGGQVVWSCLKYIPHRLAGAILISPVVNYWWHNLPSNLTKEVYSRQLRQDRWTYRVAHYLPFLTYWYNSQKWFYAFSIIGGNPEILSFSDMIVVSKLLLKWLKSQPKQQGEFDSVHLDLNIGFGKWDFDPLDLENPFPNNNGSVHLWTGDEDRIVPTTLNRYIAQQLGWVNYHEGPPITSPRIQLHDGRYMSYEESGVPKDVAKSKLIYVHCFDCSKHLNPFAVASPELVEELGVYIVAIDRPGYGESDPDPKRTVKSLALDIEEFADKLNLGPKFYVTGFSMGGQVIWSCLKYIPHRLAGSVLISPAVNYWWHNLPSNLTNEAYSRQLRQDQWTYRVAHYFPLLTYWYNSQKWFYAFSIIGGNPEILSFSDMIVVSKLLLKWLKSQPRQQGEFESVHLDLNIGFGKWDFDPLDLENPFPNNNGSVHLWAGDEDRIVPTTLNRYIAQQLRWVNYHELGSADGLPITSSRIQLRDGRHLSYTEFGVPKDVAKSKIIYVHCFFCGKEHNPLAITASPAVVEELGVYIVAIDRPGYGESDPDPKRTLKSLALDIEEFADHLNLGPKFYVAGFSYGGQVIWSCLKYIPNRLAGAILISPAVNYWWHNLPSNLTNQAYSRLLQQDKWSLRVAHYIPWLTYWWNTQTWFPGFSIITGNPAALSSSDIKIAPKLMSIMDPNLAIQQGEFESLHRDLNIGFGKWEFDPLDLENPFPNNDGSVHLWMGDEDLIVPAILQRYIAQQIGWINYHEITGEGHTFAFKDGMGDAILKEILYKKK